MTRNLGAQIGMLAFIVALVAGLYAGNSATVILMRAIVAMIVGATIGQTAGWAAKAVLRDYLQRRKQEIDQQHFAAIREIEKVEASVVETTVPTEVGEVS